MGKGECTEVCVRARERERESVCVNDNDYEGTRRRREIALLMRSKDGRHHSRADPANQYAEAQPTSPS